MSALAHALLWPADLGLLLALLLRRPLRRWFGAGPACAIWHLPWLLATVDLLPWQVTALPAMLDPIQVRVSAITPDLPVATDPGTWLARAWIGGTVLLLGRLAWQYLRLRRACRPMDAERTAAPELRGIDPRRLQRHPAGPAVLWTPRGSHLLLPDDFALRFDPAERALVVRHERTHMQRGDGLWRLLGECGWALLWWNPLAWLARPRLYLDCELACDERVLHAEPQQRSRYARTLLAGLPPVGAAMLTPWLSEPQLKERLTMIEHFRPDRIRPRAGLLAIGLLALFCAVSVRAQSPASPPASNDMGYDSLIKPTYPKDALASGEQGTVILKVRIGANGMPRGATLDTEHSTTRSALLIAAATNAVMQWRFRPKTVHGSPVESFARVPVDFRLHRRDPAPPATAAPVPKPHQA